MRERHRAVRDRRCRGAGAQRTEGGRDGVLDRARVDVADGDHGLPLRAIPRVVVGAQPGRRRRSQDVGLADGQPVGVPRVVEDDRDLLVADPRAGAEPAAPLLDDDAAFLVDFGRVEVQAAGEVGERRQPACHDVALVGRQVEHVDGLVEARVGVHVRAEPGAEALEVADELAGLEVGAAVERHVLDEVREPLLVVGFLERPRLHGQPQRYALFRAPVAPDEVLEPVRQRPRPDRRRRAAGRPAGRSAAGGAAPAGPTCFGATTDTSSASAKTAAAARGKRVNMRMVQPYYRVSGATNTNGRPP